MRITKLNILALFILILSIALSCSYWPGLLTWDSVRQYGQAVSGSYDDWHPPIMEWIWRQFLPFARGPAPMLMLQLSCYAFGFAMMILWAWRQRRYKLSVAIALCALMPIPIALMGEIIKDSLMTAILLAATGLIACVQLMKTESWQTKALRLIAAMLIFLSATLRFNAFLAGLPLLIALFPMKLKRNRLGFWMGSLLATVALLITMPLANRLIHTKKSGVELSLVIFDLAGITEHSGVNAFPDLGLSNPVAINQRCYSPVNWDAYAWWVDAPCPIQFAHVKAAFEQHHTNPYVYWMKQIAAHPIAYATHRLAHWNIATRFLVKTEIQRPVQLHTVPNEWHFQVKNDLIPSMIDRAARISGHTPLGWPCVWIILSLTLALMGRNLPSRSIIVPLALSAFLYALGFSVFSVASELRYYLWTIVATAIAAVIAVADIIRSPERGRKKLITMMIAPATIIASLCLLGRLML